MKLEDREPDDWEAEYYVLAAYDVIEAMQKAELLTGPLDVVTSGGHQKLLDAYVRGWRPLQRWLLCTVVPILEDGCGESWSPEDWSVVDKCVKDYVGTVFPTPEDN